MTPNTATRAVPPGRLTELGDNPSRARVEAARFTAALAARGVWFAVRNNRLWLLPQKEYANLTDDERAYIRHHREELKELATGNSFSHPPVIEYEATTYEDTTLESAPTPSQPEDVTYDVYTSPGTTAHTDPEILGIVNYNTPAAISERHAQATRVMLRMLGATSPYLEEGSL